MDVKRTNCKSVINCILTGETITMKNLSLAERRQAMKRKKFHKTFKDKILNNPLWYLFGMIVLVKGGYETYNNYRLERDGICTTAVIYGKGRRFNKFCKFQVDGVTYYAEEWTSKTIGDTVTIVYLPSNPKINRGNKTIKKCNK